MSTDPLKDFFTGHGPIYPAGTKPEIEYTFPLQDILERIAKALEEQNRISQEWIAAQVDWHEVTMLAQQQQAERELRIIDIHQANAEREQAFRDTQIQVYSEHLKRQEEVMQESEHERTKLVRATLTHMQGGSENHE